MHNSIYEYSVKWYYNCNLKVPTFNLPPPPLFTNEEKRKEKQFYVIITYSFDPHLFHYIVRFKVSQNFSNPTKNAANTPIFSLKSRLIDVQIEKISFKFNVERSLQIETTKRGDNG